MSLRNISSNSESSSDNTRGVIIHPKRRLQIVDYSGLRFGNITPTDIDGFIDFGNYAFVFIDLKHITAPEMPYGQRLALVRLALAVWPKPALIIIAKHNIPVDEPIPAAEQQVTESFENKDNKWLPNDKGETVQDRIVRFLRENGLSTYTDNMSAFSNSF